MTDPLLELEMRLFILRYGRSRVLRALASLGVASEEAFQDVEGAIAAVEARKVKVRPRAASTQSLIAKAFRDRPELFADVETVVKSYEDKTFLPQLRDVQRFLDRFGPRRGRLKSRSSALRPLINVLTKMNAAEIAELSKRSESNSETDYAVLAREIMGDASTRNRIQRSELERREQR